MSIKNILVLYKKSSYKHYFLDKKKLPECFNMNAEITQRFKNTHLRHYQTLEKIESILKKKNIKYSKASRGRKLNYSEFDMIVTVGGDGTFLEAARHVRTQIILGVNSDPKWSVGRFCYANQDNFEQILDKTLNKKAKVKLLQRIKLKFKGIPSYINVLNDILVCHKNPAAMSRYSIQINDVKEEHRSSGVWISTAAGSTGAIFSAGGKVLPFESRKIQYRVRELYFGCNSKHELTEGVIMPLDNIKLSSLMKEGVVYIDGSHKRMTFSYGDQIAVSLSPVPLRVITF